MTGGQPDRYPLAAGLGFTPGRSAWPRNVPGKKSPPPKGEGGVCDPLFIMKLTGYLHNSTKKAFILRSAPDRHSDVWLPRSQCKILTSSPQPGMQIEVEIPEWLAGKLSIKFNEAGFEYFDPNTPNFFWDLP